MDTKKIPLPFKRSSHRKINNANGKAILEVWSGGCSSNEEADEVEELVVRACNRDHVFDDMVRAIEKAVDKDLAYLDGEARGITHGDVQALREALQKARAA